MLNCPICNTIATGKKTYCSDACRQKAYRARRKVTSRVTDHYRYMEFMLVLDYLKETKYIISTPTYDEYAFIKTIFPEVTSINGIGDILYDVHDKIRYGYLESPYRDLFKKFLQKKV